MEIGIPKLLLLNANHRWNRWQQADKTKTLRWLGYSAGLAEVRNRGQLETPVRLIVTVHWPDRRRRDEANLAPTAKALIDGFVDAGLLPDDDGTHLIGPDFRRSPALCAKRNAAVLAFEFLTKVGERP